MNALSPMQIRLLVVEPNPDIQGILREIFTEEGYDARFASSIQEALPLVDEGMFQLILADLFAGRSKHSFTEAHILRRRALPTPTALMTTQNLLPEEAQREGFAFLVRKPFDLEELLAEIAHALQHPLTPEQQRQALLVECYVRASNEQDWDTLVSLLAEELIFYPPAYSSFAPARKIVGKAAFLAYLQASARAVPCAFQEKAIYPRRAGLAMRFRVRQISPCPLIEEFAGAMLFRFAGERICRISATYSAELMRVLVNQPLAS